MNNKFFCLSELEQATLIEKSAEILNMSAVIIEKDIWICWLLEKIFSLSIKMSFKGGTSLSKVFNLISRFSEDCDITVDYHNFEKELDLKSTSGNQLKKIRNKLKENLKNYIVAVIEPYLNQEAANLFSKGSYKIIVQNNGEKIEFHYPSVLNTGFLILNNGSYLRNDQGGRFLIRTAKKENNCILDHVLIEFGCWNSIEPSSDYRLTTYLEQALEIDLSLPKPSVNTLSPIRTFFEKATLIHVECHRKEIKKSVNRLSRHWYDLYALYKSKIGKEALSNFEILKNVIEFKKAFCNSSYSNYDACLSGEFRLIPDQLCFEALEKDYTNMINDGMFNGEPPSFENIIVVLRRLEKEINNEIKSFI